MTGHDPKANWVTVVLLRYVAMLRRGPRLQLSLSLLPGPGWMKDGRIFHPGWKLLSQALFFWREMVIYNKKHPHSKKHQIVPKCYIRNIIYLLDPKHPLFEFRYFGEFPSHFSCWTSLWTQLTVNDIPPLALLQPLHSRSMQKLQLHVHLMLEWHWRHHYCLRMAWTSWLVVFLVFVCFFLKKKISTRKTCTRPSFLNVTRGIYFFNSFKLGMVIFDGIWGFP